MKSFMPWGSPIVMEKQNIQNRMIIVTNMTIAIHMEGIITSILRQRKRQ